MQSYVETLLLTYEMSIGCFSHYEKDALARDTNILITNSQTYVIFTKLSSQLGQVTFAQFWECGWTC